MDSNTENSHKKATTSPPPTMGSTCCVPRRFFTQGLWIEGEAEAQLDRVAALPGVFASFAMPDLHPGKGVPIGSVVATERLFYPHLAGNDLGCGVLCAELAGARRLAPDALAKSKWLREEPNFAPWAGHLTARSSLWEELGLDPWLNACTLGGGNHFLEISQVESVYGEDPPLAKGAFVVLAHSGSRHLGEAVARLWSARSGAGPASEADPHALQWLAAHDACLEWAAANRLSLVLSAASTLGVEARPLSDTCHNAIERVGASRRVAAGLPAGTRDAYLHRKGASRADGSLALLPGSRGDYSYLLRPTGVQESAMSLAHGAGRKWKRSDCEGRLSKMSSSDLTRTKLGSRVVCQDKALLFEEAPQAYKDCSSVLRALVEHGLAEPRAKLRPLLTLKI